MLGLAHPAEGVALGVAGVLVAATLYSAATGPATAPAPGTSTATPTTTSATVGTQDVASYGSPLLHRQPLSASSLGTGVRKTPMTTSETTISTWPSSSSRMSSASTPEPASCTV